MVLAVFEQRVTETGSDGENAPRRNIFHKRRFAKTLDHGIIMHDQVQEIINSGHAPTDMRESAIIASLPAGNYTAIVRGVNNTTGVALVEVYDLQ